MPGISAAPRNFAVHLAKHGEEVYMLSAVGDDALGYAAKVAAFVVSNPDAVPEYKPIP